MRTERFVSALRSALALAVLAIVADSASAQPRRRPPGSGRGEFPRPTVETTTKAADDPLKIKAVAIVGADVYTVTREIIRRGTVLMENGKIVAVGQNVAVPPGAELVDGRGKFVCPGFTAMSTQNVGLRSFGTAGPTVRFADMVDPYDRNLKWALSAGITSGVAEILTGGGGRFRRNPDDNEFQICPCCGMAVLPTEPLVPATPQTFSLVNHVALRFAPGELDWMILKESPFYYANAGSLTGSMNRFNWRETIRKAKKYAADLAQHQADLRAGKNTPPPQRPVPEDVVRLVKKEASLRIPGRTAAEIRDLAALAKELDYLLVIDGAQEAWLAIEELAAAKAGAIYTPRNRRRSQSLREDQSGSFVETPGLFEKAGIPFAVQALSGSVSLDGIAGRDLMSLPLEAAFAVRGGASERAALASLTIVPAQMLGLGDKIGSIEDGKDADVLVLSGPPLDYRTYVERAYVLGKLAYDRGADALLPATGAPPQAAPAAGATAPAGSSAKQN